MTGIPEIVDIAEELVLALHLEPELDDDLRQRPRGRTDRVPRGAGAGGVTALAKPAPVDCDDQQDPGNRDTSPRNDRPEFAPPLGVQELCGDEPAAAEQDEQEPDLGEAHGVVMRDCEDESHPALSFPDERASIHAQPPHPSGTSRLGVSAGF